MVNEDLLNGYINRQKLLGKCEHKLIFALKVQNFGNQKSGKSLKFQLEVCKEPLDLFLKQKIYIKLKS